MSLLSRGLGPGSLTGSVPLRLALPLPPGGPDRESWGPGHSRGKPRFSVAWGGRKTQTSGEGPAPPSAPPPPLPHRPPPPSPSPSCTHQQGLAVRGPGGRNASPAAAAGGCSGAHVRRSNPRLSPV